MVRRFFLLLWLLASTAALAAEIPEHPMFTGTIAVVHGTGEAVIISDQLYYLTATTQVKRLDGRTGSVTDLADGLQVAGDFYIDEAGRFFLKTIWMLPDGEVSER